MYAAGFIFETAHFSSLLHPATLTFFIQKVKNKQTGLCAHSWDGVSLQIKSLVWF